MLLENSYSKDSSNISKICLPLNMFFSLSFKATTTTAKGTLTSPTGTRLVEEWGEEAEVEEEVPQ